MEYKDLVEQLVKKCLEKGADGAEVLIQTERNLSIEVRNGEIETLEEASSKGVGFRVFAEGKTAFSSCNDFSEEALDNAISGAIAFAANLTSDENNVLPEDLGITQVEGLYDQQLSQVSMDKKIEMAKTVEKLAMKDPRITKSAGARYGEGEGEIFLANSNGLSKSKKTCSVFLGVSVVAEKGDQKSSGGEYCSRRHFADLKSLEEIAEKAARDAYEMLDPQMVKTQKAPVIFDPDVARAILGGILAAIDGERVLQGASFLRGSLDKKISSDLVTLIDDGTRPKGMASSPFDAAAISGITAARSR